MPKKKSKKQKYTYKSFDFEFEKVTQPILHKMEDHLNKYYGSKCKVLTQGCRCCEVWSAYEHFITLLM